jgi:hypothetical protein
LLVVRVGMGDLLVKGGAIGANVRRVGEGGGDGRVLLLLVLLVGDTRCRGGRRRLEGVDLCGCR